MPSKEEPLLRYYGYNEDDLKDDALRDEYKLMQQYKIKNVNDYKIWYEKKFLPKYKKETNTKKMENLEDEHRQISECVQHGLFAT